MKLDLSWTAPTLAPGVSLSGYDVHYTSANAGTVADDAAVQTGPTPSPGDGWVAASHSGTGATAEITGLDNGTAYRVRVRSRTAAGASAWLASTGPSVVGNVLVSNVGHSDTVGESMQSRTRAQCFTTGSAAGGYGVGSVDLGLSRVRSLNAGERMQIIVELWSATTDGSPSRKLRDLTTPSSVTAGNMEFAAPAGTTLTASTTYCVVFRATSLDGIDWARTGSADEDATGATGAAGWSIADRHRYQFGPTTWFEQGNALQIRVNIMAQGDITPPSPVFSPQNGRNTNDAGRTITLTFAEFIRKDSGGTALEDGDLAEILTLKVDDDSGTPIDFSASIDADKLVITIDPTSPLADGDVYVAISNGYFDTAGNRGLAAEATFTVDTSVPTVTIGGVPEAINAADALDVTFTFSEDVTDFVTADVTVTGGTKGTFQGSGKSYTLAVTPGRTADVVVTVRANAATDGTNQGPAQAVAATARWDTTGPAAPTFSPASGDAVKDAGTDITITFEEALRKDANGTALENADLASILTLKVDDENGNAIGFAATIDDARKVITLDPTNDLAEGAVHVAISAEHWDAAGNQGSLRTATFTVDTTAPAAPQFSPANAATVSDASTDITITFAEALRKDANGTALNDSDLAAILTLTATNASGTAIPYAATIDAAKKVITVNPDADLDPGKVYVAISADHWDAAGNQGSQHTATFTVDTGVPTVTISGVPEAINAATVFTATFTFSEDVTGFVTADVTVTGGTKGTFQGSGKSYTLAVTPGGTADVVVTVAANAATDGANQGPPKAVAATARWDTTAPAAPDFSPAGGATVGNAGTDITITFDEALRKDANGTALDDADLANILTLKVGDDTGTAIGFAATIDADKKVITLDPTSNLAEGDVYVAISNQHWDAAGNRGTAHNATFTVDTSAPTLTISGVPAAINAATAFTATFAFSKDVTGFDTADVTVTGGAKGTFQGSGKSYTLAVTPTGSTDVVVTVRANAATDGTNQGPPQAVAATATWDTTPPAAPDFSPASGARVSDTSTSITLTFAEALRKDATGTALNDADLAAILTLKVDDNTGAAIGFAATIDADKKVITLDPTNALAEGKVYVAISAEHWDAAGNKGSRHTATFTVDTTAPAAPEFSPVNGHKEQNPGRNITLTFAEAVKKSDGSDFSGHAELSSILALKVDDGDGADIDYAASINAEKTSSPSTPHPTSPPARCTRP